jgi:hypothetical protein
VDAATTALMFATGNDVTGTDPDFFARCHEEAGGFVADMAALETNRKVADYYGPDHADPDRRSCLSVAGSGALLRWPTHGPVWMNPPYSEPERACRPGCTKKRCPKRGYHLTTDKPGCYDFVREAAWQRRLHGAHVWLLVAARTDVQWFHRYLWNSDRHAWRPGIHGRFLPGRLTFEGHTSPAPFPSLLVVMRPEEGATHG